MELRDYRSEDCAEMAALFYETIHKVNARDYTAKQLDAWVTGEIDLTEWDRSFLAHDTRAAVEGGQIIGFGDMESDGYLNRLYVHWAHIGCGVGRAIVETLESRARLRGTAKFTTHASITAKPFFARLGYTVIRPNIVVRRDVELQNFLMVKEEKFLRERKLPLP